MRTLIPVTSAASPAGAFAARALASRVFASCALASCFLVPCGLAVSALAGCAHRTPEPVPAAAPRATVAPAAAPAPSASSTAEAKLPGGMKDCGVYEDVRQVDAQREARNAAAFQCFDDGMKSRQPVLLTVLQA